MEKRVCLGKAEEVLYFFNISSLCWYNQNAQCQAPGGKVRTGRSQWWITLTVSPRFIFFQFRCCGVSNYTDWFEVYNTTRVPDSCCLEFSENCGLHSPGTWWKAVSGKLCSTRQHLPCSPGEGRARSHFQGCTGDELCTSFIYPNSPFIRCFQKAGLWPLSSNETPYLVIIMSCFPFSRF